MGFNSLNKQQNLPYQGHSISLKAEHSCNKDDEHLIETVYYIHLKPENLYITEIIFI